MIFTRSFAGFLSSNPRKWGLLCSTFALRPLLLQTGVVVRHYRKRTEAPAKAADDLPVDLPTTKDLSELPRPIEIPFQPLVANSVNIIGTVDSAVKLHQLSDGSYASVLILVSENTKMPEVLSRFMITVVFQGDLAEIAACHLKKNDLIYVSGAMKASDNVVGGNFRNWTRSSTSRGANSNVCELFIPAVRLLQPDPASHGQNKSSAPTVGEPAAGDSGAVMQLKSNPALDLIDQLWKKLVDNPEQWFDNRLKKTKETQPDFRHKDGEALWLDSAPAWVFPELPPQDAVSK
ncbi:hypothetical protein KSP40_PGU005646 [Platanthera guangdongensis]|uniref:Uncharacterized protein n=1 Tax=Platanthera guangdongensis TaxID=2320717 RepID=A0ABR2MYM0_9ASPA